MAPNIKITFCLTLFFMYNQLEAGCEEKFDRRASFVEKTHTDLDSLVNRLVAGETLSERFDFFQIFAKAMLLVTYHRDHNQFNQIQRVHELLLMLRVQLVKLIDQHPDMIPSAREHFQKCLHYLDNILYSGNQRRIDLER